MKRFDIYTHTEHTTSWGEDVVQAVLSVKPAETGKWVEYSEVEEKLRLMELKYQTMEIAPSFVLAKQTAVEIPWSDRKELGHTLLDGIGVFKSADDVHRAITELGLPLGWVSLTVDQLLPGGIK